MSGHLSIRKYAESIGKSHTAVRKWIAAGMPMAGDKVDPEAANAWRAANRESLPEEPTPAASPASATPQGSLLDFTSKGSAVSGLTAARTEREQLKAQRERMRLGVDLGELVPAGEVEAAWAAVIVAAQNALLNVADKAAGRVARSKDENECRSIIDREIREALASLSRRVMEMAAA